MARQAGLLGIASLRVVCGLIVCLVVGGTVVADEKRTYSKAYHVRGSTVEVTQEEESQVDSMYPIVRYRVSVKQGREQKAEQVGELDGRIVDSWLSDLDKDDLFEIIFWTSSFGTGHYGSLLLFEWNGRGLDEHQLPESKKLDQLGYEGHDGFRLDGQTIVRTFPTYKSDDANCCPTGGEARAVYRFEANELVLKGTSVAP